MANRRSQERRYRPLALRFKLNGRRSHPQLPPTRTLLIFCGWRLGLTGKGA